MSTDHPDNRRTWLAWAAACLAAPLALPVIASDFPAKPVRMLIGFPAGGGADIVGRLFADRLSRLWGQQVVVENRGGAAGVIGTEAAAAAAPDGYTFYLGTLGTLSINPHLYPMRIDPATAFAPLTEAVAVHFVLVVHPDFPARSVRELVALARQKPGAYSYSSSGAGGGPHLAAELFNNMAGVKLVHVPYKGSGPSFTGLLGNQVAMTFDSLVQALPHIKAGKLRPLAVLGKTRSPLLPDVPSMEEAGLPGYEFTNWFGFVAPAGTPPDIVRKLHADITRVQSDPATRTQLAQMGADVTVTTPEQFGALIKADQAKWGRIVKEAGIKAE
ncbi:MAG TPA: tripartite tricarboxylate transporter substrate binding protein [Ramlibacter sp.]|nr:tripartite tricarboxylate transporter substrate binding protein [Ramlibacter sp.]